MWTLDLILIVMVPALVGCLLQYTISEVVYIKYLTTLSRWTTTIDPTACFSSLRAFLS
jgi:uncharacterized integral membrane protein